MAYSAKLMQEWGRKFPVEKLDAAKSKAVLKRLATVEVRSTFIRRFSLRRWAGSSHNLQDVAQQILCFAHSQSVTGQNAVIDAGWALG